VTAVVNSTVTVGVAEVMNGSKFIDNWTKVSKVIVSIFFDEVVTIIEVILVCSQESTMTETVGRSVMITVATAIASVGIVAIASSIGLVAIASTIGIVAIASVGIVAIASTIGIVAIASTIGIVAIAIGNLGTIGT